MAKHFFIFLLQISFFPFVVLAQTDSLQQKIARLISTKKADVGVSIYGFDNKEKLTTGNGKRFPMQSVFKFHIALAVLNEVDKGRLSLTQKIHVKKSDLLPNTWSPLREKYANGGVSIPLSEIISYTVSQSDNNGCDILLRLIGGPKKVNNYIHSLGIGSVSIAASEEAMHKEWNVQFSNWTTPEAATSLLQLFLERKMLSQKSYDFLWKIVLETTTGKDRIKGLLPPGTPVAHKTGTSDTNQQGITAAINDIGIVTLPGGRHFAISVFVANSKENTETNEKIIAGISKLAWDYFISNKK